MFATHETEKNCSLFVVIIMQINFKSAIFTCTKCYDYLFMYKQKNGASEFIAYAIQTTHQFQQINITNEQKWSAKK